MKTTFNTALAVALLLALPTLGPDGACCRADPPPATAPALDARYVRMEVPAKLIAHQVFQAAITMKNTGTASWGEGFSLFSQDPANSTTWGTHYIILGQGRKILPGQEATFSSWLKAPAAAGRHGFVWRAGNRQGLFGQATETKTIQVAQRPPEPAPPPPRQDPAGRHVLTFDDFEYAGSFKLPESVDKKSADWAESGLALRAMPDGTRRLFMRYWGILFEVEVPELVKLAGGDHSALKRAEVRKVWGPLGLARPGEQAISSNAEFWWDQASELLYWSSYHGYWTGGSWPLLAATRLADDGTMTHYGPWRVNVGHFKAYWGGVTPLPKSFAEKYTGGRWLGLGFGGYYSICASASNGPALAAAATPDPNKKTLDIVELLVYPFGKGVSAIRDGDYFVANCSWGGKQPESPTKGSWTMEDHVASGIFLDLPRGHAFIAFADLGVGRMGYDYGSIGSAEDADWWYFYDPKDLGAVAGGRKKPWEVQPHSRAKVDYPLAAERKGRTPPAPIFGSCFDAETKRLYLYKRFWVDNKWPCVHVYRVK